MLQAFAIVKTLSFLTLEGDSKAEQTLNKHTCVGKQNHLKAVLKKKKKKKPLVVLLMEKIGFCSF